MASALIVYLSVDDGGHPEAFGGPRHRQHGPEEDQDGQDEGEERSRHDVVQDDDEVTQHLRLGHHRVVEGKEQLQRPRQRGVKLIGLGDLVTYKHAVEGGGRK